MRHRVWEEDGRMITELDREAIGYLEEALQELVDMEPGEELVTPYFDGEAVGELVLRRAVDSTCPEPTH